MGGRGLGGYTLITRQSRALCPTRCTRTRVVVVVVRASTLGVELGGKPIGASIDRRRPLAGSGSERNVLTHTHTHTHARTRTHADEGFDELAHSHTSSAQGRVRAAGLVNPECSEAVGVPPSHGPSEGGVDPRLVQVGERSQRATHNSPRGPAPDVRDCRIRHGGWLLVLCLTMGGTGKLRGRPESRACRCGGGAPLPGSSACPDWPTRSQAEWRLRHARDRCCRCVSVGTSTRRRSAELAVRGHQLSSTCVARA